MLNIQIGFSEQVQCLCTCTSAGMVSCLPETWFAGAEGVCAVGDTVSLVSITTLSSVTPAVVQFGV